jgi:cytochrome P450 family 144
VTEPLTLDGDTIVEDPYPFFARLRAEAPVWQLPGVNAFFVSTWELVNEAVSRPQDFSNHFCHMLYANDDGSIGVLDSDPNPIVFAGADPPEHTVHRKLFFSELLQQKMAALEPVVVEMADDLLDRALATPGFDAMADFASVVPLRIMAERVIGFRDADLGDLQKWVFGGSVIAGGRLRLDEMAERGVEVMGLVPWVDAQLDEAIAAARQGDVLGAAATGVRDGVLTHEQASFTLMVLLGAGGETTTTLMGNAIRMLAERPGLQRDLRASPDRVPAFIEEALRLEAPFSFHPKSAPHDTELGGVTIPAGAMVATVWGAANRDEVVFENPDELVLDRPNARLHMGFGRGIHYCVGAALARLETRVVLQRLLARTEQFTLEPDDPPTWTNSMWIRRHDRLPIVVA